MTELNRANDPYRLAHLLKKTAQVLKDNQREANAMVAELESIDADGHRIPEDQPNAAPKAVSPINTFAPALVAEMEDWGRAYE